MHTLLFIICLAKEMLVRREEERRVRVLMGSLVRVMNMLKRNLMDVLLISLVEKERKEEMKSFFSLSRRAARRLSTN